MQTDHLHFIPEVRGADDGGGGIPPMRLGVVGEWQGTGDPDVALKTTGRRHSFANAISGIGDDRRPIIDDCY